MALRQVAREKGGRRNEKGRFACNRWGKRRTNVVTTMKHIANVARRIVLVAVLIGLAGGCTKSARQPQASFDVPEAFSSTGSEPLRQRWWHAFDDGRLSALIDEALAGSFTLQTAWDRLAQAEAVAERTGAALWPDATLQAGAGRSMRRDDFGTTYTGFYSVGVAAGYEIDLWSRLRSTQKAAWLDAAGGRDAVDTAAITLAASVAGTWYQLAEAKALAQIDREQIQTNSQVLEVVTIQFRKGVAAAADVLRQRQLIESSRTRLILAEEAISLLQYTLAVLIGRPPTLAWSETSVSLPVLPPPPNSGVPSEVLWRRPDVRRAYRRVQAADYRLAAAIAEQYPRVSLSAEVETSSVKVRDLFDDWLANLAGNAVQPLFDADLRKAEVRRQRAVLRESIHIWNQAVLDALQDVETALTQERQQGLLVESLRNQLELARETYERNRERFIKGQVDYIRVLESLTTLQTLERSVVSAEHVLIQRRIDLYRSLAGPFELTAPPEYLEEPDAPRPATAAPHDGRPHSNQVSL